MRRLRVCSYEDRPDAMDGVLLMAESLCRADQDISLHLTVPNAPPPLRAWAAGKPNLEFSTDPLDGASGWDVKPFLLLQELNAGFEEALWVDADIIFTGPVSNIVEEFPPDILIVAEEWDKVDAATVAGEWATPAVRVVTPVNSCFVRAKQSHKRLLERWLEETRHPVYREAQKLPFEQRLFRLSGDQVLLTALLQSEEFREVSVASIQIGRHIAQCAGSSGYRPGDRLLDLFRGLPAIIHCIGRKPWDSTHQQGGAARFGLDLATDVSAYVLAAREIAKDLNMDLEWIRTRTLPGAVLRNLTGFHPGLAGLPLAIAHTVYTRAAALAARK